METNNILILQDLYTETLVREIIEKTKSSGIVWNSLGGTQYKATEIQVGDPTNNIPDVNWDFIVTETQTGNTVFIYNLTITKNNQTWVSITDGTLLYSGRDNEVQVLYEMVNLLVLQLDANIKDTSNFVKSLPDALNIGSPPQSSASASLLASIKKLEKPQTPTTILPIRNTHVNTRRNLKR